MRDDFRYYSLQEPAEGNRTFWSKTGPVVHFRELVRKDRAEADKEVMKDIFAATANYIDATADRDILFDPEGDVVGREADIDVDALL